MEEKKKVNILIVKREESEICWEIFSSSWAVFYSLDVSIAL